ncbi:MAG: hypothetical protein HYV63_04160 [Candidatus Schekmanbacteria bacterium]|nr:hypothetical protein [Candidatus Schekmanbacteria bacterium]
MSKVAQKSGARALVLALAMSVALASAREASAEENGVSASVDVAMFSAYIWRGQVINDEAVLQPSLTVEKNGLSINAWSSMNMTNRDDAQYDFSELDVTVSYARALGPITVEAALLSYTFPGPGQGAQGREACVSLSADVPAAPTVAVYYGFSGLEGIYASLSVGHSLAFGQRYALDLEITGGYGTNKYNALYFGVAENRMNDVTATAAFSATVTQSVTVTPVIQYAVIADSKVADGARAIYGDDRKLVAGISIGYAL